MVLGAYTAPIPPRAPAASRQQWRIWKHARRLEMNEHMLECAERFMSQLVQGLFVCSPALHYCSVLCQDIQEMRAFWEESLQGVIQALRATSLVIYGPRWFSLNFQELLGYM